MNDGYSDESFVPELKSFPIRTEIIILPADEPKQLKLGLPIIEKVGIGVVNPRGVAAGRKSTNGTVPEYPKKISIVK